MSVIKMYNDASAATKSRVDITVPRDGVLYALDLSLMISDLAQGPGPASQDSSFAELSFIASPTHSANGETKSIAQVNANTYFVDAARLEVQGMPRVTLTGLAIPVYAGEKIYMHITPDASMSATAVAYLFIQDGLR